MTEAVISGANGRVLVVEDDDPTFGALRSALDAFGYEVLGAATGRRAIEIARAERPDLILLDLGLPDVDGRDVAKSLRHDPKTSTIPIVLLTAAPRDEEGALLAEGFRDFMQKPVDLHILRERLRIVMSQQARYAKPHRDECLLTIHCRHDREPMIVVSGASATTVSSRIKLDLDPKIFDQGFAAAIRQQEWRDHVRTLGSDIYERVFGRHNVIEKTAAFHVPRGTPHLAAYRFQTSRADLCTPFETLFDAHPRDAGEYLALSHPLSRFAAGVVGARRPPSREFFEQLGTRDLPLRVLLIASNTTPSIPGVDAEVDHLYSWIPERFRRKRIRVQIDRLSTAEATTSAVRNKLRDCAYHIVHYAGHGLHVPDSPNESGLFFWSGEGATGEPEKLPATALQHLLSGSETLFFYLSCCEGTTSAAEFRDDYLGVADALIGARVPSVLGFRHPVSDDGAQKIATSFYAALAEHGELDLALFHARRDIAEDRRDRTWLTPMLIVQS